MKLEDLREHRALRESTEPAKNDKAGFVINIEKATMENTDYRRVLFTSKHNQLVLMCIEAGDEIGTEVHNGAQFIRVEKGTGQVVLNGKEYDVEDGSAITIPQGVKHNVINTSKSKQLKIYTVYSPPQHKPGETEATKEEADKAEEKSK